VNPGPAGVGVRSHILYQLAPEQRLPERLRVQGFFLVAGGDHHIPALLPGTEPVGAEHLVLVEQIRHLLGQLEVAQVGVGAIQKPRQRREGLGLIHQVRQQPIQAPDQPALVEGRLFRHFAVRQHRPVCLPDKPRRKQEIHAGGDTQATFGTIARALFRQRQLQPLGNTVTLDQEGLALQRGQRVLPAQEDHCPAQVFQMIGMDGVKAGLDGGVVGHGAPCWRSVQS